MKKYYVIKNISLNGYLDYYGKVDENVKLMMVYFYKEDAERFLSTIEDEKYYYEIITIYTNKDIY